MRSVALRWWPAWLLVSGGLLALATRFSDRDLASYVLDEPQLRVPSLLPQLIAMSSVVFIASMLLVLSAEIGRRLAERRFGRDFSARGLV